jgi:hypothetical protein
MSAIVHAVEVAILNDGGVPAGTPFPGFVEQEGDFLRSGVVEFEGCRPGEVLDKSGIDEQFPAGTDVDRLGGGEWESGESEKERENETHGVCSYGASFGGTSVDWEWVFQGLRAAHLVGSVEEFVDRFAVGDHRGGSSGEVGEVGIERKTEVVVAGGEKVVGGERTVDDFVPFTVGGSDDLAHFETSSREEDRHGLSPVFATGLPLEVGKAWGVGHFSHDEEEDVAIEAALFEVFDQGGNDTIEDGKPGLHFSEDIPDGGVVVPTAGFLSFDIREVDGDETNTGFDESSSEEALLSDLIASVSVAEFRGFAIEVEGVARGGTDEDFGGFFLEAVHSIHQVRPIEIAAVKVELFKQVDAVVEAIGGEGGMHTEAGDVELGGVEIASDVERFETAAEIGGAEIADVIECDMCRDIGTSWSEELVDDRPHVGVFGSVGKVFDEFAGVGRGERVRGVDVAGAVVAEGANEGEAIGHRSETRQMF